MENISQKKQINSITLLPNPCNITLKKTHTLKDLDKSDNENDSDDVDKSDYKNDSEPEELKHFSESNISTYNRYQVLDKLSRDSSDQTFEHAEKFEVSPIADSEGNLDSNIKLEERQVIDEFCCFPNVHQK